MNHCTIYVFGCFNYVQSEAVAYVTSNSFIAATLPDDAKLPTLRPTATLPFSRLSWGPWA